MVLEIVKWILIIGVSAWVVGSLGFWAYKRITKTKDKFSNYTNQRKNK